MKKINLNIFDIGWICGILFSIIVYSIPRKIDNFWIGLGIVSIGAILCRTFGHFYCINNKKLKTS